MDFYEVLDQVIDLLKQRQRITYRAIKRQFSVDDAFVEDLKEELLYSPQPVEDDDGRGFIWTGKTDATPVTTRQFDQPEPQSVGEQAQPPHVHPSSMASPGPDTAERRQLTVMFIDIVESMSLASQLDPEDLRTVLRAYQSACTDIIQRYDGHVAQLLGDGLLVYFGYPQAHEDDAQRAVRTGLGILEALATLNARLEQDAGTRLAVRLGIHTGPVVVGEMGGEGRQEQLALGATPNVAARIQGLAAPDTVVISDTTYRLIQGFFDTESLGEHDLRGVAQPRAVYQVFRESGAQSRLDIARSRGLTPLVGRESEVTLLLDRWEQVQDGQGQVVLLSGEAGIGKSRLVQVLKDHVADTPHTRLECRSSPYFTNSALYPIIDLLPWTLQFQHDDAPDEQLVKLEKALSHCHLPLAEAVPLFAAVLSVTLPEDRYPPLAWSPQRQRQKTLEYLLTLVLHAAEHQPVLFVLEDLHWTDPTTLEFLDLLIDQTPTACVCVLLTCRPDYQPTWSHRPYLTEVTINRLSQTQIERMVQQVADGKRLPTEVIQQLADKTDGVPLYVEEMTKAVLESGVLKETTGHYELTGSIASLSIPATLQDSLMARLDRLVTAKAVAQYASVIGRQFSYELLQAVSQLDEAMLQYELGRLVEAELIYQRGLPPQSTYIFKHALIQDTAYESLLRSTRQGYHHRIAEVLEERFPETAETQPELLAHHYTEARMNEQAVGYWQQAGGKAIQRSAYVEALAHLTQGLALLTTSLETPSRLQQEIDLQIALGFTVRATKGNSAQDVKRAYARARKLCQQIGDTSKLFPALRGLVLYHQSRGELQTAYQLGEELLHLAQAQKDAAFLALSRLQLGMVLFYRGEPTSARIHHMQALAIYTPQEQRVLAVRHMNDSGIPSHSFLAWELWQLGYPEQALKQSQAALTLAQEMSVPLGQVQALLWSAILHQHRCEVSAVREQVTSAMTLAIEQRFVLWEAYGMVLHGWVLAIQGQSNPRFGHFAKPFEINYL